MSSPRCASWRARRRTHGLDPARIGILGSSTGAHLGSMVALAGDKPMFADAYPEEGGAVPPVRCLIAVYGPYDLFSHWQADLARNARLRART